MIEEQAIILDVLADGRLVVGKARNPACGQCATPCTDLNTRHGGNDHLRLEVNASGSFRVGDRLILGMTETGILKATLKLYLLPVLGLLSGASTGHLTAQMTGWSDEGISAAGAVAGLILVIGAVRRNLRNRPPGEAEPVIIRRIP